MKKLVTGQRLWRGTLALLLCGSLIACGGSGGSNATEPPAAPTADTTALTLGITDAEGDFLQYEVALDSVQLVNAAGDQISVLPTRARIDFAQYTDVTEILSVAQVPVGVYTRAQITVDFSDASLVTQDAAGNVLPATAVDTAGNPLAQITVDIDLAGVGDEQGLRLRPGVPARFTLDFDLDASNTVAIDDAGTPDDVSDDSATTLVAAVWVAEPRLDTEREHRLRGLLQSVDSSAPSVTLALRPFHLRSGAFGEITLALSDAAVYEIDQQSYAGADGVNALAALAPNSPLVAIGHFVQSDERFLVDQVFAGSSVPWAGGEFIKGVVTARDGNSVTVQGVRFTPEDAAAIVSPSLQFLLTDDTRITYAGQPAALDQTAISIGQRLRVYDGTAGGEVEAQHISLLKNQLRAKVIEAADGLMVAELALFNGRRSAAYQWAQSGTDAANYRILDNGLPHNLIAGDYLKARGWVSAYDFANNAAVNPWDFEATTLIDLAVDARGAGIHIVWDEASLGLAEAGADRIQLILTDADAGVVHVAGFRESLADVESVTLTAADTNGALYSLAVRGEAGVQVFLDFADFSAALAERVAAGDRLHRLSASGQWQDAEQNFAAKRLVMSLVPATAQ